jgi:hypothetical protein
VDVAEPLAGGVSEAGFKPQAAFVGQPETPRLTELLNPAVEATVMVDMPDWPCMTENDDGFADTVKSGAAFTVTVTVVECEVLGPVPVMVSVYMPEGVLEAAVTVRVDVAELLAGGVTEAGFKPQVAFAGQPETPRLTELLNPAVEATVMVDIPDGPPCVMENDGGLADTAKSGVGGAPQPANLNEPMWVLQLKVPSIFKYWFVYQKVQSSAGSMRMAL